MVMTSATAAILTSNAIQVQDQETLVQEISLAERAIRNAASRQLFEVRYNASQIGNPVVDDIEDDSALSSLQIEFRDAFQNVGYYVRRDSDTGYWNLRWTTTGAEALVSIYSIRTSVTPGPVLIQTIAAIDDFFLDLVPIVLPRTELVNVVGTFVPVYYEYTSVVQQNNDTDHSAALRLALIASGLGYTGAPNNIEVYKVA